MRSLSEPEGRSRAPSDYWVGPEPSYVHAMSTTPEHGTERMVSFHPSERDMDDTVSGSIARSRLLFGKGRKVLPVLSTTAIPPLAALALHLFNSHFTVPRCCLPCVFLVFCRHPSAEDAYPHIQILSMYCMDIWQILTFILGHVCV